MNEALVVALGLLALLATRTKGVLWAFSNVYIPTIILIPVTIELNVVGLPDLTSRRAVCVGLILGAALMGTARRLVPRWRWFDGLSILAAVSFSLSFGLATDVKGFVNYLPKLMLDWACPYMFVRALLSNEHALRKTLRTFSLCAIILAILALYECRMATRVDAVLWRALGMDVAMRPNFGGWRWGYLRAAVHFSGPLCLGTFFAGAAPLAMLWGILEPKRQRAARVAALACAVGCLSTLSRGPILVMLASSGLAWIVARRARLALWLLLAVVVAGPFAVDWADQRLAYTRSRLAATGNTAEESGHYRIALLLIYTKRVAEVGWFGDRALIGQDYERVWSIDNAYLYLFLLGGWVGGGCFCLIVAVSVYRGGRYVVRTRGRERALAASTVAAFGAVAACMANVWFSPDYAPFFWITAGLVANLHLQDKVTQASGLTEPSTPCCLTGPDGQRTPHGMLSR